MTLRPLPAGDLGVFRGGSGFPLRFQGGRTGDLPFFKVSDMNLAGNEIFMTRANNYITEQQRKQIGAVRIPAGAIVLAKVGAAVFLERKRILSQDSCIDNNMVAFVADNSRIGTRYAHHILTNTALARLVATTALPALSGSALKAMELSVHEDLCEQSRVAEVLSDTDELVDLLTRVVAKKEAIKQGLMQELLTGRTRLPGFDGEWAKRRLADIATKIQDGTHFSPVLGGTQFRYITSRNIGLGQMRLGVIDTISEAEHRKIYARCDTAYGDLLLTKDGANTGNAAINPFHEEISLLSSVAFVRCDPAAASEVFVMYYLLSHHGRQQVRDAMAGNAITRLTLAKIRNLVVPTPSADEQRAIAGVIADADDELAALRARIEKAKAIKQGMMQELLTGRTRLPIPEPAGVRGPPTRRQAA